MSSVGVKGLAAPTNRLVSCVVQHLPAYANNAQTIQKVYGPGIPMSNYNPQRKYLPLYIVTAISCGSILTRLSGFTRGRFTLMASVLTKP